MVRTFLPQFPAVRQRFPAPSTLRQCGRSLYGQFRNCAAASAELKDLEAWLPKGFDLPSIEVPPEFAPFAEKWWAELKVGTRAACPGRKSIRVLCRSFW